MSEHLYEAAITRSTGAAAAPILEIVPATLAAGKRPPVIREIGVFVNTATVVTQIGLGRPAAIGVTPTGSTVQALNSMDTIAGNTLVADSWGTPPTAPTNYMRRADLQAAGGAGVIWTWDEDEFVLWSGASIDTIVLWQLSAQTVIYDAYVKVAE